MDFYKVRTIEETKTLMMQVFKDFSLQTEQVNIQNALNKVLAFDVHSDINVPHFNRSIVDGYAVKVKDVQGASENIPAFLKLIGTSQMGEENTVELHENECMYVPTGGMVPDGTQAMVMVEHTQKISSNEIAVYKTAGMFENMLRIGEDIKAGEIVLRQGKRLMAQDIGVLASTGYSTAVVYACPKFCVLSTGNEIISPDCDLSPGKIKDINTYTISAQIESFGGEVVQRKVIKDDYNTIKRNVVSANELCDVVFLSGGSSVGEQDYTYDILKELSKSDIIAHGLNIKPGKPTIVAEVKGKPVIGLPGQPASALIVLIQMLNILHEIFYQAIYDKTYVVAKLDQNVASAPGRKTFQMVQLEQGGIAKVIRGKSGMISMLSKADGYFVIDENSEGKEAGEQVRVYPLN
jgi:molybdopterin molybdotransferase